MGRGDTTSINRPGATPQRAVSEAGTYNPSGLPAAPGNAFGTRPSKPTSSTACTLPDSITQPPPRTSTCAASTPGRRRAAARAAAAAASSSPAGSSTSICGVRPRSSPRSASWNPEMTASDRMSAATPSPIPPAATADRKLAKASRRVLRR